MQGMQRDAPEQTSLPLEALKLLDHVSDYILALNPEGKILFANQAYVGVSGVESQEIGWSYSQDLWPNLAARSVEAQISNLDAAPISFTQGHRKLEFSVFQDFGLTFLRFREEPDSGRWEGTEPEFTRKYREVIDSLPQIAWVADLSGKALYFNARWYAYTGLARADSYEPRRIIHPDDFEETIERRTRAFEMLSTYETEVRLRRFDGEYRWHLTRAEPVMDSDGEILGFVGTSTDIHVEKTTAAALRESERSIRIMTDSVPVLIAFVDRHLVYRFVNHTFEEWFLRSRGEIVGHSLESVLGKQIVDGLRPLIERSLAGERQGFARWVDYPAGKRFVQVAYIPRADDLGVVDGFYVLTTDLSERIKVEEALLESEGRFRAIVQAMPQIAWSAGADGIVQFYNLRFYEYTGLVEGTVAQNDWQGIIHPDDWEQTAGKWAESLESQSEYSNELRIRKGDGTYRWFLMRTVPVKDQAQKVDGWFGTATDIEDQKVQSNSLRFLFDLSNATRELREPAQIMSVTAELLGRHLNATRCAYCEVDSDEEYLLELHDWSPSAPSLSGVNYPLSRFGPYIYEPLRSGRTLVGSDVSVEASPAERDALLELQIRALVACPLKKEGKLRAIVAVHSDHPRQWTSEEVSLVQLVIERCWAEIERARAERRLSRSADRLRQILEAATVGVIVNDVPGVFKYANPPLLNMLGYTREDLEKGQICWRNVQDPTRAETDDLALEQLRASGTCSPFETELIAKNGDRVPVYMGAALVPSEEGEETAGAVFVTDLTPLKLAHDELNALNAELDQRVRDQTAELRASNEALEAYSYYIAHDLRAPLRSIISTSRILEEDFGDEVPKEAAQLLDRQVTAANRLGQLIDDLLKLSRLSRAEIDKSRVNLSDVAAVAAQEALGLHSRPNIQVEVQPDLWVEADPSLLHLTMLNLIENAIKYSPTGGLIRVGRTSSGVFYVSDEGIGFDTAFSHKIFEPFQRLHKDTEFSGTGIGLSNVRQIIKRHGGEIWVESEIGAGSTFFFTFG